MFWDIFYQLCEENNTKPNSVAKMIGVSSATCTKWKNGAVPNGETLLKLADCLNVSVDYLLGRTDEPKKINYGVENHGDNNGAINNQVNSTNTPDGISKEMLVKFEELNFIDKVKVMSLIAELSEKKD